MFPCVSTTPFRRPVVPEVEMTLAIVSAVDRIAPSLELTGSTHSGFVRVP
jgi:hypothetical protein